MGKLDKEATSYDNVLDASFIIANVPTQREWKGNWGDSHGWGLT